MLVRVQLQFPATGEVLAPFEIAHYVVGDCRGSHMRTKSDRITMSADGAVEKISRPIGHTIDRGKIAL